MPVPLREVRITWAGCPPRCSTHWRIASWSRVTSALPRALWPPRSKTVRDLDAVAVRPLWLGVRRAPPEPDRDPARELRWPTLAVRPLWLRVRRAPLADFDRALRDLDREPEGREDLDRELFAALALFRIREPLLRVDRRAFPRDDDDRELEERPEPFALLVSPRSDRCLFTIRAATSSSRPL